MLHEGIRFQVVHRQACSILSSHWCFVHPAATTYSIPIAASLMNLFTGSSQSSLQHTQLWLVLCTSRRLQYSILIGALWRNSFLGSSQTSLQHTQLSLVLCKSRAGFNTQFLLVLQKEIRFQVVHIQACSILSSHWCSVHSGGYNTRFSLVLHEGIRFQLVHRQACSILNSHWCSVHSAATTILGSYWCFMKEFVSS